MFRMFRLQDILSPLIPKTQPQVACLFLFYLYFQTSAWKVFKSHNKRSKRGLKSRRNPLRHGNLPVFYFTIITLMPAQTLHS